MGDANFNKGGVTARNLRAGDVELSSGNDHSISFDRPMKGTPKVTALSQSANSEGVFIRSKDQTGFTLGTDTSNTISVDWIAFNDDRGSSTYSTSESAPL